MDFNEQWADAHLTGYCTISFLLSVFSDRPRICSLLEFWYIFIYLLLLFLIVSYYLIHIYILI